MSLRRLLITVLTFVSITAAAQRRVAAEVEVKTLYSGKVTTVESKVFCSSSGRLVQVFESPTLYYTITNSKCTSLAPTRCIPNVVRIIATGTTFCTSSFQGEVMILGSGFMATSFPQRQGRMEDL